MKENEMMKGGKKITKNIKKICIYIYIKRKVKKMNKREKKKGKGVEITPPVVAQNK